MITTVKNWWNRDLIKVKAICEQRFLELETVNAKLAEATDRIQQYEQQEAVTAARQESVVPWFELKSSDHNAVKGIQMEMDWNPAFIQYLKEANITGRYEEQIVQKWLVYLYQDLIDKLETTLIDRTDGPQASEFEG